MNYHEIEIKQALRRHQVLDPWLPVRYAINPYSGCEYECSYCRANWKSPKTIYTKKNIVSKLTEELKYINDSQLIGVGGGYNDVFGPINLEKKLSEKIIIQLLESGHRPLVMTKNPFYALGLKKEWLAFPVLQRPIIISSVTQYYFYSDKSFFFNSQEGNVPSVKKRLTALKELSKDFSVGIFILPIVGGGVSTKSKLSTLSQGLQLLLAKVNDNSEMSNFSMVWGQFRGPQLEQNETLISKSTKFPNYRELAVRRNYQMLTEQFHHWTTKQKINRWVSFADCKNFLSPKDLITVLLLRYYYAEKNAGAEKQGFRYAGNQLNRLSEKEFIDLFSKQKLESIPGVGEVIAGVITSFIKSKNLDFFRVLGE